MSKPKAKANEIMRTSTGYIYARFILRNWLGLKIDSRWTLIGYSR